MSTGGVDSSGIDHGSAGILGKPNELEAPKRAGKSAADVDKCYDWSSIFLITRNICHHGEYCEQVSNETSEGQSDSNLDSEDSDERHAVDFEDDFFTGRVAVDFCWFIGFIVSMLCRVKMYSLFKQFKRSRAIVCIPGHTFTARLAASSKCSWQGRHQSWAVSNMIGIFLVLLVFRPVVEGSVASSVSTHQRPNLDMSQLAKLDIDPVLLQFIGNVVTELKEVKTELHHRTQVFEMENKAFEAELQQVKKDKNALENKTHMMEAENTALRLERAHE
eukprot:SAG31_NODE_9717_length_1237_cov_1.772408_1_plen_275_part_10